MLIIILAAVLVLGGGGAGAWVMLKPKPDDEAAHDAHAAKHAAPPTFMPLESMVVNLADPGGDRYAQVGVTLELSDPKVVDNVKAYMPVIRSGVLLAISKRTSAELLAADGKERLTKDILREVSEPLGFEVSDEDDEEHAKAEAPAEGKKKSKKPKKAAPVNPVKRVLFSSFIVQ